MNKHGWQLFTFKPDENVDIIKEIVLDTATSNVYLLINDLQDWFSNKIVHSI